MIGTFTKTRPACTFIHLPATFDLWMNQTFCICGKKTWEGGKLPVIKCRQIYSHHGQGAELLGWDIYWLEGSR